jgi:hypothetical protein
VSGSGRISDLTDCTDRYPGMPDAATIARITAATDGAFEIWLRDRRNRRQIPHRLEQCGYVPIRNDAAKDGLWKINGARQVVYAGAEMSIRDRIAAVHRLMRGDQSDQWGQWSGRTYRALFSPPNRNGRLSPFTVSGGGVCGFRCCLLRSSRCS